jgi:hypothetical protein
MHRPVVLVPLDEQRDLYASADRRGERGADGGLGAGDGAGGSRRILSTSRSDLTTKLVASDHG